MKRSATAKPIDGVIGIDGGGTGSRGLCLALQTGQVVRAEARALNYYATGLDPFRKTLSQLLKSLLSGINGRARAFHVVIGTASLFDHATPSETRRACRGLLSPGKTSLLGDALVAVYGANLGKPGALVAAGTGSIAVSLDVKGQFRTSGGFGPLLSGDPGSAFWLGCQAVRAAVQAEQRTGKQSPIGRAIRDYFHVSKLEGIIPEVYGTENGVRRVAGLAGCLAATPLARKSPFLRIQAEAGRALADLVHPLLRAPSGRGVGRALPIFGAGSVLRHNRIVREALEGELSLRLKRSVRLETPQLDGAAGAALLALRQAGIPVTETLLTQMK